VAGIKYIPGQVQTVDKKALKTMGSTNTTVTTHRVTFLERSREMLQKGS